VLSKKEKERYLRQIAIDRIGESGQEKLKESSVLVIGAGGLGSPILMYIVSAGVGQVGIVDGDFVSLSNLARQILYTSDDIGKKKVLIAKNRLNAMNPDVKIEIYPEFLNEKNARGIFEKYSCIVDATDNFKTRYLINKTAVELNKPLFVGAVGRFTGQVVDIMPDVTPCYNCIFPEKDEEILQKLTERNRRNGVFTPLVGIIGTLVANEVLKFLLQIGENFFGKLLVYDALTNDFSVIPVKKDPDCKICGLSNR